MFPTSRGWNTSSHLILDKGLSLSYAIKPGTLNPKLYRVESGGKLSALENPPYSGLVDPGWEEGLKYLLEIRGENCSGAPISHETSPPFLLPDRMGGNTYSLAWKPGVYHPSRRPRFRLILSDSDGQEAFRLEPVFSPHTLRLLAEHRKVAQARIEQHEDVLPISC